MFGGQLYSNRGTIAIMTALLLPVLIGMTAIVVDVGFWYGSYVGHRTQIIEASIANARSRTIYSNWLQNGAYQTIAENAASIASPSTSSIVNIGFSGDDDLFVTAQALDASILSKIIGVQNITENLSAQTKSYVLSGGDYVFVSQ